MTKTFKKLAIAGAVSTALGAGGMAFGAMDGYVGEAFLVPLVTYDLSGSVVTTNTVMTVYAPGTVGQDTIPNDYTARNTTAGGNYSHPGGSVGYHWFYFNPSSVHILDSGSTLTANDLEVIDWANGTNGGQNLGLAAGQYGYVIVANEGARDGSAATMAMAVEAVLQVTNAQGTVETLRLPTYAMSDGVDTAGVGPRIGNECVYSSRIPNCSPLISGIRMNNGDGNPNLDTIIQLFVNRDRSGGQVVDAEDLHVVWLDRNDPTRNAIPIDVFDDDELQCSSTVDLSVELNVLYFEEIVKAAGANGSNTYRSTNLSTGTSYPFCKPNGEIDAGFVQYNISEIGDNGGGVDAAGAAFGINACVDTIGTTCTTRTLATDEIETTGGTGTPGLFGGGVDYILRIAHDLGKQ